MTHAANAEENRLLAALPEADRRRWLGQLESIGMPCGQVLYELGVAPSHAYFPTTAIVSLQYIAGNGASMETSVVGREGMVGVALFLGDGSTSGRAVVRGAGRGFRISAHAIRDEFKRAPEVTRLLPRYMQAQITQTAQTVACNRLHTIGQQFCRCLLLTLDRSDGSDLELTQETIAKLLGVRRGSVSQAALALQDAGLIRYARGRISVLDRAGLMRASCECYGVVRREYDRLLPPPAGSPVHEDSRVPRLESSRQLSPGKGWSDQSELAAAQ